LAAREDLPCQRDLFDLPQHVCYLNAAYMGPSLTSTASIWAAGAAAKSTPWALSKDDFYADRQSVRQSFADLVGCTDNDVAIQSSSSYGAATAAANVTVDAGQNIVTLGGEHTSNRFIWQQLADKQGAKLRVVAPPCPTQPSSAWTEAVLDHIDGDTAVAAIVPNFWLDGTMIDLAAVSNRCREAGASLVIDGTQSIGAVRFDVEEIKPDFLFVAGYKWMLCPYRLSFFYADPKYHSTGATIEQHGWGDRDATSGRALSMWGMEGAEDADGRLDMRQDSSARRFDMGEASDFSSLAAASNAISQLAAWQRWGDTRGGEGRGSTAAMLSPIVNAIADEAVGRGWIVPQQPAPHMIGIRNPTDGWPTDLVPRLWAEHSVHVSVRGPCLRVSPYVYNRIEDVPVLFNALDRVLRS
jgi:selenocysteine lyase/cysteine desulfurase